MRHPALVHHVHRLHQQGAAGRPRPLGRPVAVVGREVDVPEHPATGRASRRSRRRGGPAGGTSCTGRTPPGRRRTPSRRRRRRTPGAIEVGHTQVDPGRRPERLVGVDVHGDSSPRRPDRSAGHRRSRESAVSELRGPALRRGRGERRRPRPRPCRRPRSRRCPAPTQAATVARPGPALEERLPHPPADDGAALQHRLLADQPAAAHGERAAGRRRGRATAYRPRPSGTPSDREARARRRASHHQPAATVAHDPDGGDQQARRDRAHDPPSPGRGRVGDERAGVLDQPADQRPGLGARAERQQLAAPGGVPEPGDQRVDPRGPHPAACRAPRRPCSRGCGRSPARCAAG